MFSRRPVVPSGHPTAIKWFQWNRNGDRGACTWARSDRGRLHEFADRPQPAIPGQAALKNALNDAIGMYGYPNIATNLRLSWRTIVATVPYTVYTLSTAIADKVPSFLSKPVLFVGAVIYQMVNIPAQLIVRLTGVTGNQIIPPQWWPYNPVPGTQPLPTAPVQEAWLVPATAVAV